MHIRVLLVDDFPLVREGIAAALEADPAIDVVGQADSAAEGLERARELRPDVIVLDMRMPDACGLVLLEQLASELPDIRVLVMTASEKADTLLQAIAAGAAGYLTKRATRLELVDAVITIHGGGSVVAPQLAAELLRDYRRVARGGSTTGRSLLTAREREIVGLVSEGMTDKEIAGRLFISPRTVQNQLGRIREKTGSGRRSELARWAVEHLAT
ncbi:MAG TPA: response regulator transcription factor [Baekduia sp.]|uniref:response regulator transcription factor n=1 Tax=Baekduia sp. TaxID=2600305 RepID=UPI002B75BC92|nr:response regulator transcription factor [Baekduia sp.]HMJ36237.1 response regulator transcription factor [Baekduia sp.]